MKTTNRLERKFRLGFEVRRVDGQSEPGRKHHGCHYLVLDLNHDKHAVAAIRAYAESWQREHPDIFTSYMLWRLMPRPRVRRQRLGGVHATA